MDLTITQNGNQVRFEIRGNIDELGAEILKQRFRELNISALKEAVLDFKAVTHIGSAGIGKLLLFYKDMALNGGKIRIENVSEAVWELFNVLKLDTIFTLTKR
ncbi:MAG: anti-anti-sigma factor [Desulfobacteraceae bacterium IS3]|nr:MAG: anti-anti-sigma factor [Desulfobacteraceae bacterium IS3]